MGRDGVRYIGKEEGCQREKEGEIESDRER